MIHSNRCRIILHTGNRQVEKNNDHFAYQNRQNHRANNQSVRPTY